MATRSVVGYNTNLLDRLSLGGTSDAGAIINDALTAAASDTKRVVLSEGTFPISTTIVIPAGCQLVGSGPQTELVNNVSGTSNIVTGGDDGAFGNLTVRGSLSTLKEIGNRIVPGNRFRINRLWLDSLPYGIDCADKVDVRIGTLRATNIRGASGFAAVVHASGGARDVFVRGFYASGCDRLFENEDGAARCWYADGSAFNIYPTNPSPPSYTFVLDAHGHVPGEGGSGDDVSDIHFQDIYLEGSGGINASGAAGSTGTRSYGLTFQNITIKDAWQGKALYFNRTEDVTLNNIRVLGSGSLAFPSYDGRNIVLDRVRFSGFSSIALTANGTDGFLFRDCRAPVSVAVTAGTNIKVRGDFLTLS